MPDEALKRTSLADQVASAVVSLILDGGHGAEASRNAEEVAFVDAIETLKARESHDGIDFEVAARDRGEYTSCAW